MDHIQNAKRQSYGRVQLFNGKYVTDLATIADYGPIKAAFDSKVTEIDEAHEAQKVETGGIEISADDLKREMALTTVKYGLRGAVKARQANEVEVVGRIHYRYTYIYYAGKNVAITRATDIRNALNDNLAICTNVTPADILVIDGAIAAYRAIADKPLAEQKTKKATGTDVLPGLFHEADAHLDNMYDLVYSYFFDTKPELVDELKLDMQIISTGGRHTGISAFVSLDNPLPDAPTSAVEGATMRIVELDRSAKTDIMGMASITILKAGTYHIEFSGPGLVTKIYIMTIKRVRMLEMEVIMHRIV
jgi:hypothetical protein